MNSKSSRIPRYCRKKYLLAPSMEMRKKTTKRCRFVVVFSFSPVVKQESHQELGLLDFRKFDFHQFSIRFIAIGGADYCHVGVSFAIANHGSGLIQGHDLVAFYARLAAIG